MPPPFELALTGNFYNVRDNIAYLGGCRDATAHFEKLPAQVVKPLQPGVDLTPEPVKAHMAANTARKETTEAEIKATKAKELNVVGAQEVTTARGLHEEFENVDPTYAETMFAAIAAAKREPNPTAAYAMLSDQSVRGIRAELKAKGKHYTSAPIEEEETPAKSYAHPSADAPTEEDEAPAKSWIHSVADSVIDKAQLHYDMMYDIVTQSKSLLSPQFHNPSFPCTLTAPHEPFHTFTDNPAVQRDRLELGPEVSDYEVITTAHAGYVAADQEEAARLARVAETQRIKALAYSVGNELRQAQEKGLPITRVGGLDLTQKDIADVIERCEQVGGSSSAANDFIKAKKIDFGDFYVDPFTKAEDLNPEEAAKPFTVKDLIDGARAGIVAHSAPPPPPPPAPAAGRFNTAVSKIEKDLKDMKAFRSRIGTTPRDFSKEIEDIENELAELKAHRAKAPGDLVPDSIDGNEGGISIGLGGGEGEVDEDKEKLEGKEAVPKKAKSRAEQRRAARQKAKGKAKA
jgi:hypothetical protein